MSRQKAIGTRFESGFVKYASRKARRGNIRRAALGGSKDVGDVHGLEIAGLNGIAELKNVKKLSSSLIDGFRYQTVAETLNAGADWGILVLHMSGCDQTGNNPSFGRNEVQIRLRDLTRIERELWLFDGGPTAEPHAYEDIWVSMDVDSFMDFYNTEPEV